MNKTWLMGILGVQLLICAGVFALQSTSTDAPEPFLTFDAAAVDGIRIAEEEGAVELTKTDGVWYTADGHPADAGKIEEVLDKLASSGGDWPVATSASAAGRFEVTEDNHQRQLVLSTGDDVLADIYLGTSPGYRRVHARKADGDDVYAITFAHHEVGVETNDWLDRAALQPQGELTALTRVDGFSLTRQANGAWTSGDGTPLDASVVDDVLGRFGGLSITDVNDATLPEAAEFSFDLTDETGPYRLDVYRLEDEGDEKNYIATSDRLSGGFEIGTYFAERLDITIDDLRAEQEAPDAADTAEADADEADESDNAPTDQDEATQDEDG